jgi:membrane protease YdiL (CAAX protease family)
VLLLIVPTLRHATDTASATARDLVLHLANKPFLALTLRAAPVLLLVVPTLRHATATATATAQDLVLHLANKPFLALTLCAAPVILLVVPTLCLTLALIFLASNVQSVLNLVHDSCHCVFFLLLSLFEMVFDMK